MVGERSGENSMSDETGRTDIADQVLLQRHASLLHRSMIMHVISRTLNAILVVLLLARPFPPGGWFSLLGWVVFATFLTLLWQSDRRSLGSQIHAIERTLGKQNESQFSPRFIAYRFEATASLGNLVQRLEPYLWLLMVVVTAMARAVLWQ